MTLETIQYIVWATGAIFAVLFTAWMGARIIFEMVQANHLRRLMKKTVVALDELQETMETMIDKAEETKLRDQKTGRFVKKQ